MYSVLWGIGFIGIGIHSQRRESLVALNVSILFYEGAGVVLFVVARVDV